MGQAERAEKIEIESRNDISNQRFYSFPFRMASVYTKRTVLCIS